MTLGHLGLAITIAGMTGAGAWRTESIQAMKPSDTVTVAGYTFTFDGASGGKGPNYSITEGTFRVFKDGQPVVTLNPEKRIYMVSKRPTTEAAIHTTFFGDLYAVVGDQDPSGAYVTRLYFNPLVAWMWAGVIIMVTGGCLSLTDRRHRIGAPAKRSVQNAAAQAAGA
jgi:cytochrome c-type biogenesis protein CcmF